jgi:hypothetical protein
MKKVIRIFFLILSLISGGLIYSELITVGFGIHLIYVFSIFLICSLIAILITTKSKIKFIHKRLDSFFVWGISITMLICILTALNKMRNLSPVLISTKFYWEEGVDVEFRKNGTFKALNQQMLGGEISYGKYELKDSLIILKDKLKFGMENMNDTLKVTNDGILFTMENPWRINKGKMAFEYKPKTELEILNNTNHNIDSIAIKLSYTKENIGTLSIKPKQQAKYKFNMTNPYVDGKYILCYKIEDQSNQLEIIRNILKGYPLETVKTIQFEETCIILSLIFGNNIKIYYS